MAKFRRKPVVLDAVQLRKDGPTPVPDWLDKAIAQGDVTTSNPGEEFRMRVRTEHGVVSAKLGDWIIRGLRGELYPCEDETFQATYEPAEMSDLCARAESYIRTGQES